MTWVIVGLLCGAQACIWYAPVGADTYRSEAACMNAIVIGTGEPAEFRDLKSPYVALKCRVAGKQLRLE